MRPIFQAGLARAVLLAAGAVLVAVAQMAQAKTYLVTAMRPGIVVLVDAETRKVEKTIPLPKTSPGNGPAAVVVTKDGKIAYVLHNRWESISGIDLDSGREVFRADLSWRHVRGKSTMGMDLSPDGKELAVFVTSVKLLREEYQVQDTHIAFFDTSAGLAAQPQRTIAAPRRTTLLAYSPDGKRLYAMSWDIMVLDPRDGTVLGKHPLRSWGRANMGEPDALTMWPHWEQSGVFAFPYYVARTDRKPTDPDFMKAGIFQLDLATDKSNYKEFEDASVVLFSSVVNPVRHDEVFTVFQQLSKTDQKTGKLLKRVDLDQSFYNINISPDGRELYIGGAGGTIQVYDSKTLKRLAVIPMPGGGDLSVSSMRVISR